jgi:uncharacterized protein YqgC (DUF456 family)
MSSLLLYEGLGWIAVLTGSVTSLFGLPGTIVFALGILVWYLASLPWFGLTQFLILLFILGVAEGAEQLGGFIGMSWSGIESSGWKGAAIGAVAGLIFSLFFLNPLLIVAGLLVGAWLGEVIGGRKPLPALKTTLGFALGKFGGYFVKNLLVQGLLIWLVIRRVLLLVT